MSSLFNTLSNFGAPTAAVSSPAPSEAPKELGTAQSGQTASLYAVTVTHTNIHNTPTHTAHSSPSLKGIEVHAPLWHTLCRHTLAEAAHTADSFTAMRAQTPVLHTYDSHIVAPARHTLSSLETSGCTTHSAFLHTACAQKAGAVAG